MRSDFCQAAAEILERARNFEASISNDGHQCDSADRRQGPPDFFPAQESVPPAKPPVNGDVVHGDDAPGSN